MILDLDQKEGLDADQVGSKAAELARALRAGLPILPGFVISGEASRHHMELGASQLEARGSGGARLAIIGEPVDFGPDLISAGSSLGPHLVARSSTALEGSGEWSGAFTSYLDLGPADLPKALTGCWAAAFSVAALERQEAAGIQPGSFAMPVLVQLALTPRCGGVAELDSEGTIVVHGVEGPPGPLLQGWVGGLKAHQLRSENMSEWVGPALVDLMGQESLDALASSLRKANELFGLNRCEWAIDGGIWILQLARTVPPAVRADTAEVGELTDPALVRVARTAMRAPGKLGERFIMPWALGGFQSGVTRPVEVPKATLAEAARLSDELTSQVWDMAPDEAMASAHKCIADLLGPHPSATLDRLNSLRPPDPTTAATLIYVLNEIRSESVRLGVAPDTHAAWYLSEHEILEVRDEGQPALVTRVGMGRWEPYVASVVLATGEWHEGVSAASGIGAGIRRRIQETQTTASSTERAVLTSHQPLPKLASLLWDAAAVVTETGSPAAHLFESTRSLGVPAVCGVTIPGEADQIVAVNGYSGVVSTVPLYNDDPDGL